MREPSIENPNRRRFFRDAFSHAVEPVAALLRRGLGTSRDVSEPIHLRPPGAKTESAFLETCRQCGSCVDVCPANAIFALPASFGPAAGTPVINPDKAACVVCEGLQCTHVCPSGALAPVMNGQDIRMGVAEVYAPLCVRAKNETCTICVDRCPLGESAIKFLDDGPPTVMTPGCVGCGICQLYCPTEPKAITINPVEWLSTVDRNSVADVDQQKDCTG